MAPPTPTGRAPAEDPQADRVVLLPTAYTHPEGTVFFSSYDIAILQAGYAFTDDTQVTLTALPIPSESFTILDLSLKTALVERGPVRVAAIGSASGGIGSDIGAAVHRPGGRRRAGLPRARAATRASPCRATWSSPAPLLLMANGVGAIWRAGRTVSLLGELATLVPVGSQGGQFNGATLGGGVRFHFENWGFDLTLIRALDTARPRGPAADRDLPLGALTGRRRARRGDRRRAAGGRCARRARRRRRGPSCPPAISARACGNHLVVVDLLRRGAVGAPDHQRHLAERPSLRVAGGQRAERLAYELFVRLGQLAGDAGGPVGARARRPRSASVAAARRGDS